MLKNVKGSARLQRERFFSEKTRQTAGATGDPQNFSKNVAFERFECREKSGFFVRLVAPEQASGSRLGRDDGSLDPLPQTNGYREYIATSWNDMSMI